MARPTGSKDKKPRRMQQGSIDNLKRSIPGWISGTVRVFAPSSDYRWFERLSPTERGHIVTTGKAADEQNVRIDS